MALLPRPLWEEDSPPGSLDAGAFDPTAKLEKMLHGELSVLASATPINIRTSTTTHGRAG